MFEGAGSRSKLIIGIDLLRDILLTYGMDPIPRTTLHAKVRNHLDRETFAAVLDILVELEMVQQFEVPRTGRGRPGILYRGTKALAGTGVMEKVTEALTV